MRRASRTAALIAVPVALVAGALVFWLLGGFGGGGPGGPGAAGTPAGSAVPAPQSTAPVAMPVPVLGERAVEVCRALLSQLPDRLRDRMARPVTGTGTAPDGNSGAEQNAAYGDPPITLACGVQPVVPSPDATLAVLSGVCWYQQQDPSVVVLTTVDREVPIAVTVPRAYTEPWQWIIEFSTPIIETVRSATTAVPSTCAG